MAVLGTEDARTALAQALAAEGEAVELAVRAYAAVGESTCPRRVWEKLQAARDRAEVAVQVARRQLAEAELAGESSPEPAERERDDEDDDYARRFNLPPWSGAA